MKKLNKLQINPEKLMKNEELMTLRGGYGGVQLWCLAHGPTCIINAPGTCNWAYNDAVCRAQCPNYIGSYYCF